MAELFDKLNKLTDSLGRALEERAGGGFGALVEQPQRQARDWTSMLGGGGGVAFGSLVGQPQQGPGWADMALGAPGGFSWSSASAGYNQRGPFDLGGFEELETLRNKRAAEEAKKNEYGQGQPVTEHGTGATGADPGTDQWRSLIDEAAAAHGIDGDAIQAVMMIESGGNAGARSVAGALGLMQVMPFHFQPGEDGMDPRTNVLKGASILADNYRRYGSWDKAVAAYLGAIDANGNITSAQDANGTDGFKYAQMFNENYRRIKAARQAQRPTGGQAPVNVEGTAFPVQGYRGGVELHWGEDIGAADLFAAAGTPVAAMRGGKVVSAGWSDIGGWNVTLYDSESGLSFYYAHLAYQPTVQAGQTVAAGTIFGAVGDTGNAKGTGAHLHLGIGYGIQSGTGPKGGSGINFNATEYLRRVLGLPIQGGAAGGGGQYQP